jgi:hypothetical protein
MKSKILAVLCCAFFSVMTGGVWSEPEFLGIISNSDLAVDHQGICWCETNKKLYSYRDDASGWLLEIESPIPGKPFFDNGDTLWMIRSLPHYGIHYVRYDGEAWSDTAYVPSLSTFDGAWLITTDNDNVIWVPWNTSWFGYLAVGYTRYHNGAWGEPQILTDTLEPIEHMLISIATDSSGRVWIGWVDIDMTMLDTVIHHIKAKRWDGDDWSDEMLIATHDWHWATGPSLTPDNEGGMWALWWHEPDDAAPILLKTRHWDGVEWSPVDTIAEAGKYGLCTPKGEIAVDAEGNAWAVWRQAVEPDDTYGDIYYSVNQGEGWSTPAPVCEHPAFDINPNIAVDGAGRIWCVWSSVRDSQYQVYASYATGVGIKEPVTPAPITPLPSFTIDKSVGREFTFRVSSLDIKGELLIYDAGGRKVRSLAVEGRTAAWDGKGQHEKSLPSGVYFVKLDSNPSEVRKIVLIR